MKPKNKILRVLNRAKQPLKASEVAQVTGLKSALVHYHLRNLMREGKAEATGTGLWHIVEDRVVSQKPVTAPAQVQPLAAPTVHADVVDLKTAAKTLRTIKQVISQLRSLDEANLSQMIAGMEAEVARLTKEVPAYAHADEVLHGLNHSS